MSVTRTAASLEPIEVAAEVKAELLPFPEDGALMVLWDG